MKRLPVRKVESHGCQLIFLGTKHRGGTYVLRIRVRKAITISFGKFRGGKRIRVASGDYAYIGSALAESGAVCLARRLMRHATRLYSRRSHPIRDVMINEFRRMKLSREDDLPPAVKKPKWNVDYLLDRMEANLLSAFLIRSPLRLETGVAQLLDRDLGTVVFEPGLGAGDFHGATHLVRIEAQDLWWVELPTRLERLALTEKMRRVHGPVVDEVFDDDRRTTAKQLVQLGNMWYERRTDLLRRMLNGATFTSAEKESRQMYDTKDWGEVRSRLGRGRGSVFKLVRSLTNHQVVLDDNADARHQIRHLADHLKVEVDAMRSTLASIRSTPDVAKTRNRGNGRRSGDRAKKLTVLIGGLKQCLYFLHKNARDIPLIPRKTGTHPTVTELTVIHSELHRIEEGVKTLRKLCARRSLSIEHAAV